MSLQQENIAVFARPGILAAPEHDLELAKYDFRQPELLTDAEIIEVLSRADVLWVWVEDIKDYALKEAVKNGKQWAGYKLIEGRSDRKYADETKVADKLLATGSYSEDDIYTRDLLNITAMEKLLGKKQFNSLMTGFIIKPPGKLTLVPIADKRPEYNSAVSDFKGGI